MVHHLPGVRFLLIISCLAIIGLAAACGGAEPPPPQPTTAPTAMPEPTTPPEVQGIAPTKAGEMAATAEPVPTSAPSESASGKDVVRAVIPVEPDKLSPWQTGSAETGSIVSRALSQGLAFLDIPTLVLGPTTATTGWEQLGPDRWRLTLREGVKFRNGEPWNAEAAAWNLTRYGDPEIGLDLSARIPSSASVVDDMTVDIQCVDPCPVLPSELVSVISQAPQWFQSNPEEVTDVITMGFGQYEYVDYKPGEFLKITEYADYVPVPDSDVTSRDLHRAYVPDIHFVWRLETTVRAAMLKAEEADFTYILDVEDIPNVPNAKSTPQWEVEGFYIDTLWHPMLKQKEFRQALVHAINCEEIVEIIFKGATTCSPIPAVIGMPGIDEENGSYWEYNPQKARDLLAETGYDGEEIRIIGRTGRVPKQPEVYEAMAGYWEKVGIKGKVEVTERNLWRVIRNCGIGNIVSGAGVEITSDRINQPPDNCKDTADSGHLIEFTPEWPTLDFWRPAARLMNCNYFQSRVCDPEIQTILEKAGETPVEEGRGDLLKQLADRMKEDVLFVGVFQAFEVHAMVDDLEYEPRPDQLVIYGNMRWTK
jgi:peptide/nickel transport system substrate-binding protein